MTDTHKGAATLEGNWQSEMIEYSMCLTLFRGEQELRRRNALRGLGAADDIMQNFD